MFHVNLSSFSLFLTEEYSFGRLVLMDAVREKFCIIETIIRISNNENCDIQENKVQEKIKSRKIDCYKFSEILLDGSNISDVTLIHLFLLL